MRMALVNLKGGVGKTTTAVHVAASLAGRARTLLIDADPERSATSWANHAGEAFPVKCVPVAEQDLRRRASELVRGYRHVVIDSAPNNRAIARAAVLAADTVVVPMTPTLMDLDRITSTFELIAELESSHAVRLLVLLTQVRAGTRLPADLRKVLDEYRVPRIEAQIPLREGYAAAFGVAPQPQVDYDAVVDEVVKR